MILLLWDSFDVISSLRFTHLDHSPPVIPRACSGIQLKNTNKISIFYYFLDAAGTSN